MLVELIISSSHDNSDIKLIVGADQQLPVTVPCQTTSQHIQFLVNDSIEQEHCVSITMQGKTQEHTRVDNNGNILADIVAFINSIIIDGIDVTELFCSGKQCYTHDFNGSSETIIDNWYGIMGCNGIVNIKFTTPIYIWFLENS